MATTAPDPQAVLAELEAADRLLVQQVFKPIANEYRISVPASGSDDELGLLEKNFTRSLLRSHWHVRDPEGNELLESHESSWIIAILRRIADILPDWFGLLGWLPFNFVVRRNGEEVGHYRRVLGKFRDRYVFEIRPGLKDVDHRLLVAFAVGLDALQDR